VANQYSCAPQKVDATSRSNFLEPIFMVQPAENISRSYPATGWQLMPMDFRAAAAYCPNPGAGVPSSREVVPDCSG